MMIILVLCGLVLAVALFYAPGRGPAPAQKAIPRSSEAP